MIEGMVDDFRMFLLYRECRGLTTTATACGYCTCSSIRCDYELIKQMVKYRLLLCCPVWQHILVSNVVQTCTKTNHTAAYVLITMYTMMPMMNQKSYHSTNSHYHVLKQCNFTREMSLVKGTSQSRVFLSGIRAKQMPELRGMLLT